MLRTLETFTDTPSGKGISFHDSFDAIAEFAVRNYELFAGRNAETDPNPKLLSNDMASNYDITTENQSG